MSMKQLIFYTFAYNAQATLRRTIDSVLGQTRADWVWHLLDNGSTDSTGEIIREAARQDGRIIALANKENHVWEPGNGWWDIAWKYDENDYLCVIDADDEYKPEFAEKMLDFIAKHDLEIAACGFDFIDAQTKQAYAKRVQTTSLIIEGGGFSEHFAEYHKYMRTMWGKLYLISVLRKYDYSRASKTLYYGGDTQFAIESYRNASRIGILNESLHRYFLYPKSTSRTWDNWRVESDVILDDMAREFLIDKCGEVSQKNDEFLLIVYFNALSDTLKVLLSSQIPPGEMISALRGIFLSEKTRRLTAWSGFAEQKKELYGCAEQLLLLLLNEAGQELAKDATEIIKAMHPNHEHPLLDGISPGLADLIPATVCYIISGRYGQALERFLADTEGAEIDDSDAEAYILLGFNLAAAAENPDVYIYFRKVWISFLLDSSRCNEAKDELCQLEQLLPGDGELAELRERLIN